MVAGTGMGGGGSAPGGPRPGGLNIIYLLLSIIIYLSIIYLFFLYIIIYLFLSSNNSLPQAARDQAVCDLESVLGPAAEYQSLGTFVLFDLLVYYIMTIILVSIY